MVFFNQASDDPIALQLVNTNECKVEGRTSAFGLVLHQYSGTNSQGSQCAKYVLRYELSTQSKLQFTLQQLEICQAPPRAGPFNLIGYSWGAVIAARTALHYASLGVKIDYLALIGAPINQSLLHALRINHSIKKMIIVDLQEHGDPIYAGISDIELIQAVPTLASQMGDGKGDGHFYYAVENGEGQVRRKLLAEKLYREGLR